VLTQKKNAESEARKPKNLFLRLFSSNSMTRGSLVSLESTDREDAHGFDPIVIRYAALEADYENARALLTFQKNERFR
jgi:hypothetical protein